LGVLFAGTTTVHAQATDPAVQALAKLVEEEKSLPTPEAEKEYASKLEAAADNIKTLPQYSGALLRIKWKEISSSTLEPAEMLGFERVRDAQRKAYFSLADRYSKVINKEAETGTIDRQRVLALAVLAMSQGRNTPVSPPGKYEKYATARYARSAAGKMIPNLTALSESNDPVTNEVFAAVLRYAQREWQEPAVVKAIEHLLVDSKVPETRLATAKALGDALEELKTPDLQPDAQKARAQILPLLGKAVTDVDPRVRVQALFNVEMISEALSEIAQRADKDMVAALLKVVTDSVVEKALVDERPLVRTLAGLILEDLAKMLVDPKNLTDEEKENLTEEKKKLLEDKRRVLEELKKPIGDALEKALPNLKKGVHDPNIRVRITSLDALGLMRKQAEPAAKDIAGAVADPDRFVRWSATRALRLIGGEPQGDAIANLSKLLGDPDPALQQEAALTLSAYGASAEHAIPALAEHSTRGDQQSRFEMLRAMATILDRAKNAAKVKDVIPHLQKSLALEVPVPNNGYPPSTYRADPTPSQPKLRIQAVQTLSRFGADARDALNLALTDPDLEVRQTAGDALQNLK